MISKERLILYNIETRIQWVDIAKGITIILMIIGHSGCPKDINNWIFSFHMPLFFVLSGLTTNWKKKQYLAFVLKKAKSLLLPFWGYSLSMCIMLYLFELEAPYSSLLKGWGGYALWFIPVLFFGLLISGIFLIVFKIEECGALFLIMFLLSMVSYAFCYYDFRLPWNMAVVPYATMYIIMGAYLNRYLVVFSSSTKKMRFIWLIISLVITILVSYYWRLDMNSNHIIPMLPLTIAAFAGTFFISILSITIEKKTKNISKLLQVIGKETFLILAFSQIIIQIINKYIVINVIYKYLLLIIILILMKYVKDRIVEIYKKMVLREG